MSRYKRPNHQAPPVREIQAPYNFAPVSKNVVYPDKIDVNSGLQDFPAGDTSYSGTLDIHLKTVQPIFIGTEKGPNNLIEPYKHPDKRFAIPGSSLRGMLRSVVEVASFSRLDNRVNDHTYGVRDLQNRDLYGKHLATLAPIGPNRKSVPYPFSCAGFMRPPTDEEKTAHQDAVAVIEVCDLAKIHYSELIRYAAQRRIHSYQPGERQSAPSKYKKWSDQDLKQISVRFNQRVRHQQSIAGKKRLGGFGEAKLGTEQKGQLVLTGQPSRWSESMAKRPGSGNPKQHDFVFIPTKKHVCYVSQETLDAFSFIHCDRGQQNRLTTAPNEELSYLLQRFAGGARSVAQWLRSGTHDHKIPIFFLPNDRGTEVKAIGLAMMFRLPYKYSVGQTLRRHQGIDPKVAQEDFSDRLFGQVPLDTKSADHERLDARKGRVWFSDARPLGDVHEVAKVSAIFAAPKASFYPNYITQGDGPETKPQNKDAYRTWNDTNAVPRGWKRIPPQKTLNQSPYVSPKVKSLDRVGTQFRPWACPKGLQFTLRFHNLEAHELGALLWAIDFGQEPAASHMIGLGRSLGYGQVRLSVSGGRIRSTDDWDQPIVNDALIDTLLAARHAFATRMEAHLDGREKGGWAASRSIFELVACALPAKSNTRHLRIDDPTHGNEFISAKKQALILNPKGKYSDWMKTRTTHEETLKKGMKDAQAEQLAKLTHLLSDESVSPTDRFNAWLKTNSEVTEAVTATRQWLGFPSNYGQREIHPALGCIDPSTSTLLSPAVTFLREHRRLSRMSKLPETVLTRVENLLATFSDAPQETGHRPAEVLRPFTRELPDWTGLGKRKRIKERSKWVRSLGEHAWDDDGCKRIQKHLEQQESPPGQIKSFLSAQAVKRSLSLEELKTQLA